MVYRAALAEPDVEGDLDAMFAALAHRSRRELLRLVLGADAPLAMSDLATSAGISPQLLNKHAAALERAGLIRRVPHGRERHVYANPEAMASAQQWITEMSSFWNTQLDVLEEYVAEVTEVSDDSATPDDAEPEPQED